jgi:LacI family transcriptional regulator
MKDIAAELGVSVVTVSKALRNHPDVSERTRQRVLELTREKNYRPNIAARALVTGRSYAIGLVVPDLVHPFFAVLAKHVSAVLRKRDYHLIIASSEEDPELERSEITQMTARGVDALLIATVQPSPAGFADLQASKTPFVLIDRKIAGLAAPFVGVDDRTIGKIATEHLIRIGCRSLAHITGEGISTAVGRQAGFEEAMRVNGMAIREGMIVSQPHLDKSADELGYAAMQKLLGKKPRPDGVFCFNDPIALGALRAIHAAGLRVPEDIAVVGAGNLNYSDFLRVPLTSVDQDCVGMGQKAARLALSLIEAKSAVRPKTVLLEPRLVVRESTARG